MVSGAPRPEHHHEATSGINALSGAPTWPMGSLISHQAAESGVSPFAAWVHDGCTSRIWNKPRKHAPSSPMHPSPHLPPSDPVQPTLPTLSCLPESRSRRGTPCVRQAAAKRLPAAIGAEAYRSRFMVSALQQEVDELRAELARCRARQQQPPCSFRRSISLLVLLVLLPILAAYFLLDAESPWEDLHQTATLGWWWLFSSFSGVVGTITSFSSASSSTSDDVMVNYNG